MIGALLIVAQVAASQPTDSTYASAALRAVVGRATATNRVVPTTLAAYTAHLETEMALIIVDTLGRERTGQIEQMGGTGRWTPDSGFLARVQGYRTQSTGIPMSMAGLTRNWAIPMLYGQRLLLGVSFVPPAEERRTPVGQRRDTIRAIHPFADDRELFYTYSGGDTVGVMTTATRRVPIIRILAHPILTVNSNFAAFDGEIDIDGDRHEIVRMRGRFVTSERLSRPSGLGGLWLRATAARAVAYVEFINAEHNGRYWLPTMQRVELQATNSFANGLLFTFRTITHFTDFQLHETPPADGRQISTRRRTVFAPSDSLGRFGDWRRELGSASSSVGASDFDDIAPPSWRGDGPPRLAFTTTRLDRAIHFNRIEGLYTGGEGRLEFRDLAPGVVARAYAGWAWSEQTVRGGAALSRSWSRSSMAIIAERRLASTQDFQREFSGLGGGISSFFFSVEEVDWVDRSSITIAHTRIHESFDQGLLTLRGAIARDHDATASLTRGPITRSRLFLPNRHARTGSYVSGSVGYEFHPNVTGELLEPGLGATLNIEAATGDLRWVRTEGALAARRNLGPLLVAARVDGGVVVADDPPPQTLFELGGTTTRLSGYEYKEFAGDRAAVGRAYASYGLPLLRAPFRLGRLLVPGPSPAIAMGMDAGWAELSSPAARASVLEMGDGTEANVLSRPTGTIRSSVFAGLAFFSSAVNVGFARPIDRRGPWRFTFRVGQGF